MIISWHASCTSAGESINESHIMRIISTDLKARFFALVVGLTYVGAFLLAVGVTQITEALELDPRPELERIIDQYFDKELQSIDAQLNCRLISNTTCDESIVLSVNRELLLADRVNRTREADREALVGQSN